jgi:hypothetical protein
MAFANTAVAGVSLEFLSVSIHGAEGLEKDFFPIGEEDDHQKVDQPSDYLTIDGLSDAEENNQDCSIIESIAWNRQLITVYSISGPDLATSMYRHQQLRPS